MIEKLEQQNPKHMLVSDGVKYNIDKLIEIASSQEAKEMPISEFNGSMEIESWDDSEGKN